MECDPKGRLKMADEVMKPLECEKPNPETLFQPASSEEILARQPAMIRWLVKELGGKKFTGISFVTSLRPTGILKKLSDYREFRNDLYTDFLRSLRSMSIVDCYIRKGRRSIYSGEIVLLDHDSTTEVFVDDLEDIPQEYMPTLRKPQRN